MVKTTHRFLTGDCLSKLESMDDDSVDLALCSPPYEIARKYGDLDFKLEGEAYVSWCFERFIQCCRVSRGLVAWVMGNRTKDARWTGTVALLQADLIRAGVGMRCPPLVMPLPFIFHRVGIPGSGGRDWLKSNYETVVCASKGKLPWSDNTACGHPPKFPPGGRPSHRKADGTRVQGKPYVPPERANPGNVLSGAVGGGHMGDTVGDSFAKQNEAPFPMWLADFFIKSFCPPEGVVLDPFSGSGTTMHSALLLGRNSISIDIRPDQTAVAKARHKSALASLKRKPS